MGLDKVFESEDTGIEFGHLGDVVSFSLFNGFKQRLGDALQGIGVEVGATIQDVGC